MKTEMTKDQAITLYRVIECLTKQFDQENQNAGTATSFELLGKAIAREVFKIGDGHIPCGRIAFMIGDWRVNERQNGGMIECALADALAESILPKVFRASLNPLQPQTRK